MGEQVADSLPQTGAVGRAPLRPFSRAHRDDHGRHEREAFWLSLYRVGTMVAAAVGVLPGGPFVFMFVSVLPCESGQVTDGSQPVSVTHESKHQVRKLRGQSRASHVLCTLVYRGEHYHTGEDFRKLLSICFRQKLEVHF